MYLYNRNSRHLICKNHSGERKYCMKKYPKKIISVFSGLLIVLMAALVIFAPVSAEAASFKKSKPKITGKSAYLNDSVYLEWTAVKGAKKYEIQRAMVKPSNGKTGKWKKWKTVKGTTIKATATGDYKYRVRAVNKKKKKSKWSRAKRVFAASAVISKMTYTPPEYFFGVLWTRGELRFRVAINNKTKSPMGFVPSGTRFGKQNTLYALNKTTGKVLKKWEADLEVGSGIAKQVNANSKQTIEYYLDFTEEEWAKYKGCKFMLTSSFYPNPEKEPLSAQMAISYKNDIKESSIAAK